MSDAYKVSKQVIIHDINAGLSALGQGIELIASGEIVGSKLEHVMKLMMDKHGQLVRDWVQAKDLLAKIQD